MEDAESTGARVLLPTALREYAGGAAEVAVAPSDIEGVLAELGRRYPPLRRHLFDDRGALRGYVRVYLNDRDVRELGNTTRVDHGDVVLIVPSLAGG